MFSFPIKQKQNKDYVIGICSRFVFKLKKKTKNESIDILITSIKCSTGLLLFISLQNLDVVAYGPSLIDNERKPIAIIFTCNIQFSLLKISNN